MKLVRFIEFLRAPPRAMVRRYLIILLVLMLLDAIPVLVDRSHAHTWAERVPGFWGIFGFVGCALLILLSKAFGHAGVMTRENYYDE
jgi:hypothetical protein